MRELSNRALQRPALRAAAERHNRWEDRVSLWWE